MKSALFWGLILLVACVFANVLVFLDKPLSPEVAAVFLVIGLLVLVSYAAYVLGYESGKRILTENDLDNGALYGVEKIYKSSGEELILLKNLDNQEVGLYRLTYAPANIFRGKDAKNFSQMKKAIE